MTDASNPAANAAKQPAPPKREETPKRVLLVPYPKIVFLYPSLVIAVIAAIVLSFVHEPMDEANTLAKSMGILFLGVLGANLVVMAFDFPRGTSLTLFFFLVALVLGFLLLMVYYPHILPAVGEILRRFHPLANVSFYWTFAGILALIFLVVMVVVRFDYWEVRPNELLHHHGILSDLERVYAPNLRIEKEINDVFEYVLLGAGRLTLQPSTERRTIILDNIPFISKKEALITRMLGALQVQVREDHDDH